MGDLNNSTVYAGRTRLKQQLVCVPAETPDQAHSATAFWQARYRETGLYSGPIGAADSALPAGAITLLAIHRVSQLAGADRGGNAWDQLVYERICGTITLVRYPIPEEHVGKLTRLAVDDNAGIKQAFGSGAVFTTLTSSIHREALTRGLTELEAIVHPRHSRLYRRVFAARPVGDVFACDDAGGAPAQRMRAAITEPNRFHSRLRQHYQRSAAMRSDQSV